MGVSTHRAVCVGGGGVEGEGVEVRGEEGVEVGTFPRLLGEPGKATH